MRHASTQEQNDTPQRSNCNNNVSRVVFVAFYPSSLLSMAPKTVRWGILATGGICQTFTKDLLIDPNTRGAEDIKHVVTAVASSSSMESAQKFVKDHVQGKQGDTSCRAHDSYEDLVANANVDIVYVGTPHSHHYQNCRLALENDKAVVCEKPLTTNAKQAQILYDEAKKRKLFFMEAAWTRFFPLSCDVRDMIRKGEIGELVRVQADLSIGEIPEVDYPDPSFRLLNMDLAGGVVMDLGPYNLLWLYQTIYHTLPAEKRKDPEVAGALMEKYFTGTDVTTSMLLRFHNSTPKGDWGAHGIGTCSMRAQSDFERDKGKASPCVRIFGQDGEIQIFGTSYRPNRLRVIYRDGSKQSQDKSYDFPGNTHGMSWEADEAARCFLTGKMESEIMPWAESLSIMRTLDKVREIGNLIFPEVIETAEYPVQMGKRDLTKHVQTRNRE